MTGRNLLAEYAAANPDRVVWTADTGWFNGVPGPDLSAPIVNTPPWLPDPGELTPEAIARHVRILSGPAAPDQYRTAGVAVWSGSVGEWSLTWHGCRSTTLGHGSLPAAEDAARRQGLVLSAWRDIGSGVHVACTFERDWTVAP